MSTTCPLVGVLLGSASVLFVIVALAFPSAAGTWSSVKYYDAGYIPGGYYVWTQSQASRQWNKVWRPLAYSFGLTYSDYSWVFDAWSNPFVDNRNAFYAHAFCYNNSVGISPVTCMTTTP